MTHPRIVAFFALLSLALSACAPGAYRASILDDNGGAQASRPAFEVPERAQPEPPTSSPPVIGRPVEPSPPRPRPPVEPPPPAAEPEAPPEVGPTCRVIELPPPARWSRIIKCPGEPARRE